MANFNAKEAADHVINPMALFAWLEPGTVFRFPGSLIEHTKLKRAWYLDGATGYRYQTGSRVAVIRM